MEYNSENYLAYRGKCKQLAEQLVQHNPQLRLARGHYYCPHWGEQAHWWTETADGQVIDPAKDQFPSQGRGMYVEFDGMCTCEVCGKETPEAETTFGGNGNHTYCSTQCYMRDVL